MDSFPTSQETLRELAPLLNSIHRILRQAAAERVLPYFTDENGQRPVDRGTFAFLLRYEVWFGLRKLGIDAREEVGEDPSFGVRKLALNGIEGTFGRFCFKFLRPAKDDEVHPPPANSPRRAAFYAQEIQLPFPGFSNDDTTLSPEYNVVLLWDYDDSYTDFSLKVALPIGSWEEGGEVDCHFTVGAPYPCVVDEEAPSDDATMPEVEEPDVQPQDLDIDLLASDHDEIAQTDTFET